MTVLSLANCVLTPKLLLLDRLTWNILNFLLKKKKKKEGKGKKKEKRRRKEK